MNTSISEFLALLSSSSPTPGGGSVSALEGALGASLMEMALQISHKSLADDLPHLLTQAAALRERCTLLIDEDSQSYDVVMKAYGMPKSNDEEKTQRSAEIQEALKIATETPLKKADAIRDIMKLLVEFLPRCKSSCFSDAAVAFYCCETGMEGALANVAINISSLKDEAYIRGVREKVAALQRFREACSPGARSLIKEKLST
jgi:formiminotetrahydrofolate cyclodeaminase